MNQSYWCWSSVLDELRVPSELQNREQTFLPDTQQLALGLDLRLDADTPSLQHQVIAAVDPCDDSLTHTAILRSVCTCIRTCIESLVSVTHAPHAGIYGVSRSLRGSEGNDWPSLRRLTCRFNNSWLIDRHIYIMCQLQSESNQICNNHQCHIAAPYR